VQKLNLKLLPSNGTQAAVPVQLSGTEQRKSSVRIGGGLAPALSFILQEVQRELGFIWQDKSELPTSAFLQDLVERIATKLGFSLTSIERDEVLAHLEKDQRPFGLLQELVDDPRTSDIIVTDYSKIAVQQGRRNLTTDLAFPTQEAYESFVERLLQRAGSTYSTKKPIADGMIGTFARIHAVHRALCDTGPYLTIRLNRYPAVTIEDLVKAGLAPKPIFDYLQAIIHSGQTLLVVGEVGTGKTTLVRALAGCMPTHESILVIEDTPEIRLEHPHVRYMTTREANTDGAGRVPPNECIRAGMRMAMNRIIFGEMRDAEAAEAFIDVCASGHPGLSTIHARNAAEAVTRLELFLGRAQKGVARNFLMEQIGRAVQVICFVDICRVTGKRRIMEVREVGPVSDGLVRHRDMFLYHLEQELPTWRIVTRVSAHRRQLEERGVFLAKYPAVLEFGFETLYRENAGDRGLTVS